MVSLKKELNYYDIVLATIGYIIGAGIYSIIGVTAKYAKEFTWISVIICGFLSLCTGLSYSELASIFNKNAGEYFYIKEAFNFPIAVVVGMIIVIIEILAINTISFSIGEHLSSVLPVSAIFVSFITLLFFSYINYSGIRTSINYNNITTIIEVVGLVLISIFGFKNIKADTFDVSKLNSSKIMPILTSVAVLFFAYSGFDFIIELSGETKNAATVIPHAMLTGLVITTLLYLFVTVSAISTIGWKNLSKSLTPMADVANVLMGNKGYTAIFIIAILSISNTILMGHVGTSRFIQGIAEDLKLPFGLDKIDETTRTPRNAILLITVLTMFGLSLGNLENTVGATNIFLLILFFMINIAVIRLRGKIPDEERKFKIPGNINNIPVSAVIGASSAVLLLGVLIFKKY